MTIDELIADIEARHRCVDGFKMSVCQTGERYTVVRSHGIQTEGVPMPMPLYDTPEEAVSALHGHLGTYLYGRNGTLYWRMRPYVEHYDAERANKKLGLRAHPAGWSARCRLCVSDKPVIWATQEEYDAREDAA